MRADKVAARYPWYGLVRDTEDIEQGDCIDGFPIPRPDPEIFKLTLIVEGEKKIGNFALATYNHATFMP
jgi:hypothetical protein